MDLRQKKTVTGTTAQLLSIVVPVYNEEEVIPEFHRRLTQVLDSLPSPAEVIFVNDGSSDKSQQIIINLRENDERVGLVDLSRNYGKEIAMTAGLDYSRGEAVIVLDADLQDPPELIPLLIEKWRLGYDNVYAKRTARQGETLLKRTTAHAFYRTIQKLSRVKIPEDTGDFRLLSRRAVDSLLRLREQHRFMKGLFSWIGYPSAAVPYTREPRAAGKTKWGYWRLWNFAIEGITSFSIAPLKIATYLGFAVSIFAFLYAAVVIYKTTLYGDPVRGYPSLMVVVLFLGAVQLIALGVIGEYLGRMFNETKGRPLYFVSSYAPPREGSFAIHDYPQGGASGLPVTTRCGPGNEQTV